MVVVVEFSKYIIHEGSRRRDATVESAILLRSERCKRSWVPTSMAYAGN